MPSAPGCEEELRAVFARYRQLRAAGSPAYQLPAGVHVQVLEAPGEAAEQLLGTLLQDAALRALGLDTEWSDSGGTVALLQLAGREACLLLRPAVLRSASGLLREALASERILKCGVAIARDAQLLEEQFGLHVRGLVDLQVVARRHGLDNHGIGLAAICLSALGTTLSKDKHIRCSDWSGPLSARQVQYAASDAFVAVDILDTVHARNAAIGVGLYEWCEGLIDCVSPPGQGRRKLQCPGTRKCNSNAAKSCTPRVRLRSSPLYGGCRMLSPDGTHLANVSRGKADWYVNRGLGELVCNEPCTFRLISEPAGPGHSGDDFYLQEMTNQCVGCGHSGGLVRFSIVPHSFRSQLPKRLREHSSHDIVLLCLQCFKLVSDASSARRQLLFAEANIEEHSHMKCPINAHKERARKAARALDTPGLPQNVREEKLAVLREYLGRPAGEPLTQAEISGVSNVQVRSMAPDYVPPEVRLALHLQLAEGSGCEMRCHTFVVAWRQLFIEALRPQCLPRGWDVKRPLDHSFEGTT